MLQASWWDRFHDTFSDTHEWYADCAPIVTALAARGGGVPATGACLHVGCGTSELGALLRPSCDVVVNVDFSRVCIESRQAAEPDGIYLCADACELRLNDVAAAVPARLAAHVASGFDSIVDKGTLDGMLSDARPENVDTAARLLLALWRMCAPGGRISVFTMHRPSTRIAAFVCALTHLMRGDADAPAPEPLPHWDAFREAMSRLECVCSGVCACPCARGESETEAAYEFVCVSARLELRLVRVGISPLEKPSQPCMWLFELHPPP